ncbi:MAG TPA: adenine phosphoribosyltransferase [Gemmatimonadaceae bacterium]|nr:adenine phosphoribosyltransferase [Gemmatimonadaceae bacterium]
MGNGADASLEQRIRSLVRDVPGFPKAGVVFKDITPLLADANAFRDATAAMAEPFAQGRVDLVAAIESRGFILGGPVAQRLGAGFVPVRKPGKLPSRTQGIDYALEYGSDRLEVHVDAIGEIQRERVLVVDDVLATGGTAAATCTLLESMGATVVGVSFLLALSFLPGLERLASRSPRALITF